MVSSNSPGEAQSELINPKHLFEEIGEDREIFHALVVTAQADLPQYLEELKTAALALDYAKVRQSAHSMKTTLAHWQAQEASGLALKIEVLCREGRAQESITFVPDIERAVRTVLIALETVEDKV